MRPIVILVVSSLCLAANAQVESKNDAVSEALNSSVKWKKIEYDTIPTVVYANTNNKGEEAAFYINGELINPCIIATINTELIDTVQIENEEIEINGKKYVGQIYINMKQEYNPKIISLTDLKLKYEIPTTEPTIYMIDNNIIKGDYDNFIVDENYILKIVVDKIQNEEESLDVNLIKILTRKEENKKVMIRGLSELTLN